MDILFPGNALSPEQQARKYERILNKAIRDLDRLKNTATGEKLLKIVAMESTLQHVKSRIYNVSSKKAMDQAMANGAQTIACNNKNMNLPDLHNIMNELKTKSDIMDIKIDQTCD